MSFELVGCQYSAAPCAGRACIGAPGGVAQPVYGVWTDPACAAGIVTINVIVIVVVVWTVAVTGAGSSRPDVSDHAQFAVGIRKALTDPANGSVHQMSCHVRHGHL